LFTNLAMAVSAILLGEQDQDETKLNVVRQDTALH
jgi:hypothetical protein